MSTSPTRLLLAALFALAFMAPAAYAQAPAAAARQLPDFSKVEINTTKLADNFYVLQGQGGAIGALVGRDGIFLVDSQYGPLTDKIMAAIRKFSDGRIRFVVNTHIHRDHLDGNANFAGLGATILGRPELRARMEKESYEAAAIPVMIYSAPLTLYMDGEEVQLIPVQPAHTDTDTMVRFRNADILMTGDVFRTLGYTFWDRTRGGTYKGIVDRLSSTIAEIGPHTRVVPGHGAMVDRAALIFTRDMILAVRDRVAEMIKQGKSADQVVAAKPTADYDGRVTDGAQTAERFVRTLYEELTSTD